MRCFYDPACLAHNPPSEYSRGRLIPYRETPRRAEIVRQALIDAGFHPPEAPEVILGGGIGEPLTGQGGLPQPMPSHGGLSVTDPRLEPLALVHDINYLGFLMTAWTRWCAEPGSVDAAGSGTAGISEAAEGPVYAVPTAWALPELGSGWPTAIEAQLGLYCFDAATPIGPGTWDAAFASARVALAAATALSQAPSFPTFALCRPPGHHAGASLMGGYCYLNNAALAAQALLEEGAKRVAILDVDYHHGNGTQSIFWERGEVFYASLHADPDWAFPYFAGHRDEVGVMAGEGATMNLPLGPGTGWGEYAFALDHALAAIGGFGADALVISLGVDVWGGDPLSQFRLRSADFLKLGTALARPKLPTVFVLEGGYAVEDTGTHVVQTLNGFLGE